MRYKFGLYLLLVASLGADGVNSIAYKSVDIIGNKNIDTNQVEEALSITKPSMLAFWKDRTPKINSSLVKTIPDTLKAFYDSKGYYDAKFIVGENNQSVRILIDEKEPIKIGSVSVESDYGIDKFITQKDGSVFSADDFVESKKGIINDLLTNGYCSYDLDAKSYIDLEKHRADIVYNLKKGDVCSFGETTINGTDGVDDSVVLSRVEAKKGERFSLQKVKDTYQRLEDLESFDSVLVNADRKIYNVVPIDITVNMLENPYYFSGGLGYDSFTGPRVQAQLVKRNFFDNAQILTLTSKYSSKEKVLDFNFFRPALLYYNGYYVDFGFDAGYSDVEFNGFGEKKEYVNGYLSYKFDKLFLKSGMALENINIYNTGTVVSNVNYGTFLLNYPYAQITYDTRDDKLNPKYGYYLSGYIEYGMPFNISASNYLKYLLEARVIYTIGDITFASVGKVGTIEEISGSIPESKLFFGGGMFSNRAFGYNKMGVTTSKSTYLKGGALSMANATFEADFPLTKTLYGAIFNDNTILTPNSYNYKGDIISSVGVGVRYITPVGPLKIDFGTNIANRSQYSIQFQLGQSF